VRSWSRSKANDVPNPPNKHQSQLHAFIRRGMSPTDPISTVLIAERPGAVQGDTFSLHL
jgi:hypothetical protein